MNGGPEGTDGTRENRDAGIRVAVAVYALFAVGLFAGGLFTLVGLAVAHAKAREAAGTLEGSHLEYLIRTGWWTVAWYAVALLTLWIGVGFLVLAALAVWYVYRVVRGALRLNDGRPA